MNRIMHLRTRREWLIIGVAMLVPVHELISLFMEYGWGTVRNELVEALAGVGAIVLMLLAWKVRKQSLTKAALLGTASMLLVLMNDYYPAETEFRVLFLILTPLALAGLRRLFMRKTPNEKRALLFGAAVWMALVLLIRLRSSYPSWRRIDAAWISLLILSAGTAVWAYLFLRPCPDRDEYERRLRWAWLLLALFCFWMLGDYRMTGMIYGSCWYSLYWYSLPLVYAGVLRLLNKKLLGNTRRDLAYFAFCTLVFWDNMSGRHYGPSGEIYYLLMPLIVHACELPREEKTLSSHLLPIAYVLLCCGLTFAESQRLRTVLYNIGGPAIGIPESPRVDWIGYRLAGLKGFFTGDMQEYWALAGLPEDEYAIMCSVAEDRGWQYSWHWFFMLLPIIAAVAVLLLRTRWENPALNRSKGYLAVGYLLRMAILIPSVLFQYMSSGVALPFDTSLMDFLVLWLLFDRNRDLRGSAQNSRHAQGKKGLKMTEKKDILIMSGNAMVNALSEPVYQWAGRLDEDRELVFSKAYEIAPTHYGEGISDVVFRVHSREFKDLSFLYGETLQEYPNHNEIRRHADGTKFYFSYESIPTFDSGDREWDSMSHIAVYADDEGINMIHCRHGYAIPRIKVYIGLKKSIPAFNLWLERLGGTDSFKE